MLDWPHCKERNTSTKGHNNDPIELEARVAACHLTLLTSLNQQRRSHYMLAGVTDPDYQGEIGYSSTVEVRKNTFVTQEIPMVQYY